MANEAKRVRKNFIWRLENLSMTASDPAIKDNLFNIHLDEDPLAADGYTRSFIVEWDGRVAESDLTNLTNSVSDHAFSVEVYYRPNDFSRDIAMSMILDDQRDIVKELNDPSKWVGYDADNTSDDIGLKHRMIQRVTRQAVENIWVLRFETICTLFESYA